MKSKLQKKKMDSEEGVQLPYTPTNMYYNVGHVVV
jgi:hypothetical protein